MIIKPENILLSNYRKHLASLALLGTACLPLTAIAQWIDIEPMNHLRFETAATQYNGDFYIFNGFGNGLSTEQTVERLDGETLTWDVVSETSTLLSTAMTHNGLVRIGADVWLIGGRVGNAIADSVRIYNIDTGLWRMGPSLPVPVAAGGAVLANNQIHWIGGVDQNFQCDLGHHFVYDLDDTDAGWQDISDVASMPEPRNHFSTVLFDGLIYTIGGQFGHGGCADINNGADTNLVHAYNPVTMTWTQVASLPQVNSHTEASTFAYEGAIYTIGGESSKQTILRYNPNTDTWDTLEPLARTACSTCCDSHQRETHCRLRRCAKLPQPNKSCTVHRYGAVRSGRYPGSSVPNSVEYCRHRHSISIVELSYEYILGK